MNDEPDREVAMASQLRGSDRKKGEVLVEGANRQEVRRPYSKPVLRSEGQIHPSLLGSPPGPP